MKSSAFIAKLLFVCAFFMSAVYAQDEDATDVAQDEAEVVETDAQNADEQSASGPFADFLNRAPFRNGVFKNPAYEEVNGKFSKKVAVLIGLDAKVKGSFNGYKQLYTAAEKRLQEGTTEDGDEDMFQMAYAYEMLSCIGDLYVFNKKVKTASDTTIDNQILKKLLSEKVQAEPAELWKTLSSVNKGILPLGDDLKSRTTFANKTLAKGDDEPAILLGSRLINKSFKDYKAGKYKDKKIK